VAGAGARGDLVVPLLEQDLAVAVDEKRSERMIPVKYCLLGYLDRAK
jgi:hypothetical protein